MTLAASDVAPASARTALLTDQQVTEGLATFCASTVPTDIPEAALDAAKYFALDFAGVALRGSLEESSRAIYDAVARLTELGPHGSSVVGHVERASPSWAALANGAAAHALELDDTHQRGSVHVGAVVFPVAFAVGEAVDATGSDLLAAAVIGYEVSCRLAMALRPAAHYARGFHPTATCGVFAATAVAGRLMGLSADEMRNAFGIAGSQAAGSLEFLSDGAWTKRFHTGWAAHAGVVAATLARTGFVGPRRILEGSSGFLRGYSDSPHVDAVLDGLGSQFEILRTSIKPHACCRYNQAPIDAVLKLMIEHDVEPTSIEHMTIGLLKVAFPIVAEPVEQKRRPRSVVDAQFSLHFAAAVAAIWRRAGLTEYRPETLALTEVQALMDRVQCVPAPELDALFPERWPATVEIVLRDGQRLHARVDHPAGDPENPLTWEELEAKFEDLVKDVLGPAQRAEIRSAARTIDRIPARSFARLLAVAPARA